MENDDDDDADDLHDNENFLIQVSFIQFRHDKYTSNTFHKSMHPTSNHVCKIHYMNISEREHYSLHTCAHTPCTEKRGQ